MVAANLNVHVSCLNVFSIIHVPGEGTERRVEVVLPSIYCFFVGPAWHHGFEKSRGGKTSRRRV
jgi:hypothetical protein